MPAEATEMLKSVEKAMPSFNQLYETADIPPPAAEPVEASLTESPAQKVSEPFESMAATGSGFTITVTAADESTQPNSFVKIN